jgi:protein gp37
MSAKTGIEWTDATWNPIRGCTLVSPGCKNCYASKVARRFSGPGQPYEGLVRINAAGERTDEWNGVVRLVPEHLADPLKWKPVRLHEPRCGKSALGKQAACTCSSREERSRRIFVNSMSDLFHESVSDMTLLVIFAIMANSHLATGPEKTHTFQILTKRTERMLDFVSRLKWHFGLAVVQIGDRGYMLNWMPSLDGDEWISLTTGESSSAKEQQGYVPSNIWLGASVENQEWADKRVGSMAHIAAAGWNTFVSYEPALEFVLWEGWEFLKWFICGGETQPGARPPEEDWFLVARNYCIRSHIPFFFKQWGDWLPPMCEGPEIDGATELNCSDHPIRVGKKRAGRLLDGREWNAFPEVDA